MSQEKLTCTACRKTWKRLRVRGRKPKLCPSCRAPENKKEVTSEPEPATIPSPAETPGPDKTSYCSGKLHLICAEMMHRFPGDYPSCSCKCHHTKP